jgi:hypothetical protein
MSIVSEVLKMWDVGCRKKWDVVGRVEAWRTGEDIGGKRTLARGCM